VKLPEFIEPQLTTLVRQTPADEGWLYEVKLDGYRIVTCIDQGNVTLKTRRGHDWTQRMPSLAKRLRVLKLQSAVIDGELVALRSDGVSDFQRLQNSLSEKRDGTLVYFAFDMIYFEGWDLRNVPLLERKTLLQSVIAQTDEPYLRYSEHVIGHGNAFVTQACGLGLEGVIAKRCNAHYRSGRGHDWLKIKCVKRQEFVVGGYTEPRGMRSGIGALLVGLQEGATLHYAGKVGTGYTESSLSELKRRLAPLEQKAAPFINPPHGAEARGVHWVSPELLAEVQFAAWTGDRKIRHATFRGLREDKSATSVRRERPRQVPTSQASPRKARKGVQ